MPDLPKMKVGIVACSGEEIAEGTVTRLAALQVLERLRPHETVTICLPLFLAGGEGERSFARLHPTITLDGCSKRCAAAGTERYSGRPAASVVVSEIAADLGIGRIEGRRRLNEAGRLAVAATADRVALLVDDLLATRGGRDAIAPPPEEPAPRAAPAAATCACGSGIPVQVVVIDGKPKALIALPVIFEEYRQAGKEPGEAIAKEILEMVRIYNPVPPGAEGAHVEAILREYARFLEEKRALH